MALKNGKGWRSQGLGIVITMNSPQDPGIGSGGIPPAAAAAAIHYARQRERRMT